MRPAVLVVEDDAAIQTLLTVLLNRVGFDVDVIGSGSDAMTLLSAVRYSALLFDLHLPHSSGHDVLEYLDGKTPDVIPHIVVVSSAPNQELDRVRSRYSAINVLRKPFDVQHLTDAVIAAAANSVPVPRDASAEFCRLSIINGAKAGVILTPDAERRNLRVAMSFGHSAEMIERFRSVPCDGPFPACLAFRHGQPVWMASLSDEYPMLTPIFQADQSRALAAVPLLANGEIHGAAGWTFREPRSFTAEDRNRFEEIAAFMAKELQSMAAKPKAS